MSAIDNINSLIQDLSRAELLDPGEISDGYHTIEDLYKHRNLLFVHLCKQLHSSGKAEVWRSIKDANGSLSKGWFLLGLHKEDGDQITYHLPIEFWNVTMFAETLDRGLWDGHTSDDVLNRLIAQL
jgi:hypothetical protein